MVGAGKQFEAIMGDNPYPWTPEIEAEIFKRIADGESLRAICGDDWLPGRETVRKRLRDDADFAGRYAQAREDQADKIFDECLAIADSQEGDVITVDGVDQTNHDVIARAKLRIDTRKWMAGKLRPKVYGDRSSVEVTGANGGPIKTEDTTADRLFDEARRLGIPIEALGLGGGEAQED